MYKSLASLVVVVMLLQACAESTVKQQKPADVTSNPSGATVYANGKMLGTTPLQHDLYDAFPAGWASSAYQAQGELQVKKSGCETFSLNVSDYVLSQPIHADMNCNKAEQSASPEKAGQSSAKSFAKPSTRIEKRLEELNALYEKGIITKNEYDTTRLRILSEL